MTELTDLAARRAAIPLGQHEPGSEGWEDARRFRLGGSEVAAVLGLSPYQSRFTLWMQKQGLLPRDYNDNPLQEWGRRIESVIFEKFTEDYPGPWQPNPGMFQHPGRRWQTANPDALNHTIEGHHDLAEFKVVHHRDPGEWGEPGTDEIPVHYRCQVLSYIDVHDLGGIWLAALLPGADYRVYRINRDEQDLAIIREEGERFIHDLMNNRAPDIDRHAATYQAVRELHPNILPGEVEIDPELAGDANPVGQLWAAAMMLQHLGETEAADRLTAAFEGALAAGVRTRDLRGQASTAEFTEAVARLCREPDSVTASPEEVGHA